jgi:uncharacterized protein YsxB (DUF464 family)
MIEVRLIVDREAGLAGFRARGHALFRPRGHDVVCAAVSTLLQTAVAGLEQVALARPRWRRARGFLRCEIPPLARGEAGARVLLESVALGLRIIASQYPAHVRIEEKRLRSRSGRRTPRRPAAPTQATMEDSHG